jgi:hypothetical protein
LANNSCGARLELAQHQKIHQRSLKQGWRFAEGFEHRPVQPAKNRG